MEQLSQHLHVGHASCSCSIISSPQGHGFSDERILHALATAGILAMSLNRMHQFQVQMLGVKGKLVWRVPWLPAACQLFGGSPAQIEYAAEMGLEHHLGMTCDPACGLVQIPCNRAMF